MEDGRQVKRSRPRTDVPAASSSAAAAASGGGGGSGADSDEERQRRAERERRFWGDAPLGLLSIVMAFLPIHLLMQLQLPPLTWQLTARKQHHLTISAEDQVERSFWQRTTIDLVREWATYLRQLTSITLQYPDGFPRWCFDVFVAIIEGHIAGRRAANIQEGTLQTITFQEGFWLTGAAMQTLSRTDPPLPALLDPPPTLDALETIAGLTNDHRQLADRRWRMPSLATVRQCGCWQCGCWNADRLGQFISSSRSLRRVEGSFEGDEWADVFEHVPAAPAGQQGELLSNLEGIGTILVEGDDPEGIERLQEVLVARGCRQSLKQLHVDFGVSYYILRLNLPVLLALDRLLGTCCRPDADLNFESPHASFDLSIFYHPDFPTHPSPSFKTMIQQLAQQARSVKYIFTQDGLADPHTDPSQSAIDIASSLSFDEAVWAEVEAYFDPPADTPSPHPAIITHLQPFPTEISGLNVWSKLGGAAGRLLAVKMPKKVPVVYIYDVSGAEERLGMLAALGREREVGTVHMRQVGIDQLVGAADELPTIQALKFITTLPDDVEDAGSFVRAGLSSAVPHIRGLQGVTLTVDRTTAEQHDSILASVPDGTNIEGFSVTCIRRDGYGATYTYVTLTAALNA
ncbi:unnamed protein product [Vitrella brassicaformis CCMP3155]|uniref:Uncharacterized protein n=1 Tax=Vitrella brassicaformis (strain CCMP3155) TaxID=1169540 RepID=A0A0G4FZI7_VITBC|nr:unnamed protein product [Vitrella brassicaformis CCMP3155]|eukprot:CEM20495.1 unnamed protein product [Vitrella brassicaformis CCMP3155]